jgi:serine/threonine protein kinase
VLLLLSLLQDRAAQFRTIAASDKALSAKVAHMLNLNDLLYDRIGGSGVSLMRGMLDYNVDKRYTASQCLQHDFFANSTMSTAKVSYSTMHLLCTLTAPCVTLSVCIKLK